MSYNIDELNYKQQRLTYLMTLAKAAMSSGFYAVSSVEQALCIMLVGDDMGVEPFEALRDISVMHNKPSLSAGLMAKLILKHGHKYEILVNTDTECTIKGTRKDGTEHTSSFSMDDAMRADLLKNQIWKKYPQAMLFARAISKLARALFPDIFANVYIEGELEGPKGSKADTVNVEAIEAPLALEEAPKTLDDFIAELVNRGFPIEPLDEYLRHRSILKEKSVDEIIQLSMQPENLQGAIAQYQKFLLKTQDESLQKVA